LFGDVVADVKIKSKFASKVGFDKLKSNMIDLSFLEALEKRGIVNNNGKI